MADYVTLKRYKKSAVENFSFSKNAPFKLSGFNRASDTDYNHSRFSYFIQQILPDISIFAVKP